jgi:hypothetical protein
LVLVPLAADASVRNLSIRLWYVAVGALKPAGVQKIGVTVTAPVVWAVPITGPPW